MYLETEDGQPLLTESGEEITIPGSVAPSLQFLSLPSYLYSQYNDDADLQAFVRSYNTIAQGYLSWFNGNPLAVYTNPNIAGPLLDWIGQGIYDTERPVFSSLTTKYIAGINSAPINTLAINGHRFLQSGTAVLASDDFYRRTLTWIFYVGDGRIFTTSVLRRRVARFIYGVNGGDITVSQAEAIHINPGLVLPPLAAPVLSQVAGGSISARLYGAQATYVNSLGETVAGPAAMLSTSANNLLSIASPPPANGATGWYPYVNVLSTNPTKFIAGINASAINKQAINGSNKTPVSPPTRQVVSTAIPIGTSWTEPTSGLIVGAALPSTNTTNTLGNFIITVPAAAGVAAQYFQQAFNQGELPFPFQLSATVVIA